MGWFSSGEGWNSERGRGIRSLITSNFVIQTEVLFELIRPIFIPLLHDRNKGKINNAQWRVVGGKGGKKGMRKKGCNVRAENLRRDGYIGARILLLKTVVIHSGSSNLMLQFVWGKKNVLVCAQEILESRCRLPNSSDVWLTVHRNSVWIRKTN